MNSGQIQGHMLTHCNDRPAVIDFLEKQNFSKGQKNAFYKYWKGVKLMKEIALQLKEDQRLEKLRR